MSTPDSADTQSPLRPAARRWPYLVVGAVLGIALTAVVTVVAMRSLMIVRHESKLGFDDTVAAIEAAIAENGWVSPQTVDMQKSMAKHGVEFPHRIKLVKLCKATYAAQVLTDSRHMSSLMPCTIAVYEDDDGKVYVAKMNTGLMGKVFGGTVAEVMGGSVARDEARILAGVLR